MAELIGIFIFFFAVIDPIGTVPVFIAVTSHYSEKTKRKIAITATLVSALVLIFFAVAGEVILTLIEIPLPAFQISGGIVLFLFAMSMIFSLSKPEQEIEMAEKSHQETAIFPLAVPSIAGPGPMLAAVLLTDDSRYNFMQQFQTILIMLSVLVIVMILMLAAARIHRIIGSGGASVISKVMGMILASVAAESVLDGIKDYFLI